MQLLATLLLSVATLNLAAAACSGGFQADTTSCSNYYQCVNTNWLKQSCPSGLNWNNQGQYCDWPASAGCTTGGSPATTSAPAGSTTTSKPATTRPATTAAPSSGSALITAAEFQCAAATKGGNPDASYYNGFIASLSKSGITTRQEAASLLAHSCWETVGWKFVTEQYCQTNMDACRNAYPSNSGGRADKVYYGRGMLQLTWDYNYKAASQSLYGDDRLIQNPDQVATDPAIGWATAAWFWNTNCHACTTFGCTLKAINGALECDGGPHGENRVLRFNHYKQILSCLNIPAPADSDGYCHA